MRGLIQQAAAPRDVHRIPYRESQLTYFLEDCIGGNAITSMVATVSPAFVHGSQTKNTLEYAQAARSIVNKASVNEGDTENLQDEINSLLRQLADAKAQSVNRQDMEELLQQLEVNKALLAEQEEKQKQVMMEWQLEQKQREIDKMELAKNKEMVSKLSGERQALEGQLQASAARVEVAQQKVIDMETTMHQLHKEISEKAKQVQQLKAQHQETDDRCLVVFPYSGQLFHCLCCASPSLVWTAWHDYFDPLYWMQAEICH